MKHNKGASDYICCYSVIDENCLDASFPATTDSAAAICRKRLFGESSHLLLQQELFVPAGDAEWAPFFLNTET